ncbi:thermonuclease family protein [Sphingomicrobium marinum]|uniref:thermonuclease family protein n=1 Tax=Sphingomicrobium marinum TaxID=1227950 RepID=UPI00223F725F|nr:thermonuclease family protein [Sphingomicrobium marinum]
MLRSFVLVALLVGLAVASEWYLSRPVAEERIDARFTMCGPGRGHACVVDGDTIKLGERKIRMLGIDAPEVAEPRCAAERERGIAAAARLLDLLNSGPVWLVMTAERDHDDYGRDLRRIEVDYGTGRERIGDVLVREGLAARYDGAKADWC